MATIRAAYRRVFQVVPYETETVELSVEDVYREADTPLPDDSKRRYAALATAAAELFEALASIGDQVVVERMSGAPRRVNEQSATVPRGQNPW